MGDYYHDDLQKLFCFCFSDANMRQGSFIKVQPVFCRYDCPVPDGGAGSGGGQGVMLLNTLIISDLLNSTVI